MKCVKNIFKDIIFYAPNWSDEQRASYGRFNELFSHKIKISRKKNISALPWKNLRPLMRPKNPIEGDIFWQKVVIQPRSYINDPFGNTS